jgi:hypothetical protein
VFGPSDRRDDRAWAGLAGARTPPLWSLVAQGGLDQAPFRTLALDVLPANDDEAAVYRSIGAGNWQRSLATLRAAIRPIHSTAPDEMDAPF